MLDMTARPDDEDARQTAYGQSIGSAITPQLATSGLSGESMRAGSSTAMMAISVIMEIGPLLIMLWRA